MERFRIYGYLRVAAATSAAIVATAICIHQQHVHIVLSDPSTYSSPLQHRCGELLIACTGWMIFELVRQRFVPDAAPPVTRT